MYFFQSTVCFFLLKSNAFPADFFKPYSMLLIDVLFSVRHYLLQVLVLVQRSSVLCMLSRLAFYCLKYHNIGQILLI